MYAAQPYSTATLDSFAVKDNERATVDTDEDGVFTVSYSLVDVDVDDPIAEIEALAERLVAHFGLEGVEPDDAGADGENGWFMTWRPVVFVFAELRPASIGGGFLEGELVVVDEDGARAVGTVCIDPNRSGGRLAWGSPTAWADDTLRAWAEKVRIAKPGDYTGLANILDAAWWEGGDFTAWDDGAEPARYRALNATDAAIAYARSARPCDYLEGVEVMPDELEIEIVVADGAEHVERGWSESVTVTI